MSSPDPFNLTRFPAAQKTQYPRALAQIRAGKKTSHWIWYIFPSPIGISTSPTGSKYAITSLSEARAYLHHPILGARLVEITQAVLDSDVKDILTLMGSAVDVGKMHACMTMFASANPEKRGLDFQAVLDRYYEGKTHEKADEILGTEVVAQI